MTQLIDRQEMNMVRVKTLECSESLEHQINTYAAGLAQILADNLLGFYIYGSLARGCYHPTTSDIDIMAVTREFCQDSDISAVLALHRRIDIAIDAVFVTSSQVCANVFPTPVQFLVKPVDGHKFVHLPDGSRDFQLQRQDVNGAGIVMSGSPPDQCVPPADWVLIEQSLDFLFPHILPNFKNPALMLCRIAYAWQHRSLCSKKQAGEWALQAFDKHWHGLLNTALIEYADGCTNSRISSAILHEFEEYCEGYIKRLRV